MVVYYGTHEIIETSNISDSGSSHTPKITDDVSLNRIIIYGTIETGMLNRTLEICFKNKYPPNALYYDPIVEFSGFQVMISIMGI